MRSLYPRLLVAFLAAAACGDPPEERPDPPGPPVDTEVPDTTTPPEPEDTAADTAAPEDTGVEPDVVDPPELPVGDTAVESVGGPGDDPAAFLFTADRVIEVDIELPQASVDALWADPYTFAPAAITIDGHRMPRVGARLKGKIGSFQDLNSKSGFKIKFDKYVDDAEFYGLKKLTLNNAIVDPSYVKEHIGYLAYRTMGVDAPRTGYAWVTVNGVPYGLYVNVETVDDTFLDRHHEDSSGNLYDGKYVYYGGWSYTLLDFTRDVYDMYQLEEGTDVGHADLLGIVEAVEANAGRPTFLTGTSAVVDWDSVIYELAVEQWIGQLDGYALNTNNNRVYFDPERSGRAQIIPWDLDYAFQYDWAWGMSWSSPRGVLAAYCRTDPACYTRWQAAAADTCDAMDALALSGEIDRRAALIAPYVAVDGRDWTDPGYTEWYQGEMRAWVERRSGEIRAFWGL